MHILPDKIAPKEAAITADSAWEQAQNMKRVIPHEIELRIPQVMSLSIDPSGAFMVYVNLGSRQDSNKADWYRLTNMEGFDAVSKL